MKKANTLILSKKVIDEAIADHFESVIDDYLDENKTEFEFEFTKHKLKKDLKIFVIYGLKNQTWAFDKNNVIVTDGDIELSYENENLTIYDLEYNPNKLTLDQEINNLIEREEIKREEQVRYSKDIDATNYTLNEKMR